MMNDSLKISFILPAFNCADTIIESVESIFNNNFNPGDEVVIINDASTDNTAEKIKQLQQKYPQIIALKHNINKGSAAAARNTGIDACKNEYFFCLDADNVLESGSVKKLFDYLIKNEADAAAFGEIHYFVNNTKEVTSKWIFPQVIDLACALSTIKIPLSSGNYLFTKNSWLKAKRYNESVGGAYDSWAFGMSQILTGTKMITMPETYYFHRVGYESTFVREVKKNNNSLLALQVLLPYLNLISPEDIEYILDKKNRYTWFDNLEKRPIKTADKTINAFIATKIENINPSLKQKLKSKIISLIKKV